MRATSILLALALSFTAANADAEAWRERCQKISGFSETIMKARQDGFSMAEMMDIAGGSNLAETMVLHAYEVTRYSTDDMRNRAIADFRDEWYLECAKALRPK